MTGTRFSAGSARAVLEQIAIVCTDNMDRSCDHRMALDFVRQLANDHLDAAQRPIERDDSTDHIDWDLMAEERLGQRPRSEHGRHIPQTSPAPGDDSGSLSTHPAQTGKDQSWKLEADALSADVARLEAEVEQLRGALEPFTDVFSEGSEDYPDDECVVVKGGRTSDFTLTIGHFRRAALAMTSTNSGGAA